MYLVTRAQVRASGIADASVAQELVERTFIEKRAARAACAQEVSMIPRQLESGAFYSLPGYLAGEQVAGIKWTTHVPKASRQGSYTNPVIVLNDMQSGVPTALVEGQLISGLRTAGVSSTALKYLADAEVRSVLICGSGFQAAHQLAGLLPFLPQLREVHFWSRHQEHAQAIHERFAEQLKQRSIAGILHPTLPDRLDFAQIVMGVTSAAEPYLKAEHFCPGHFYVHIGMNDIEAAAIQSFDHIVCDDFRAGVKTSSQSLFRLARTDASIEEKVTLLETLLPQDKGERAVAMSPIKQNKQQKLMFNGFGLPIFDLALAAEALRRLQQSGEAHLSRFDLYGEEVTSI
ncbi:ornithine cyclodeaminase family protein [Paenibacillus antibioticophila]|uniref:ornithine cyclodeaminase family protein n=1 Tax=Paenibacillus antibioticophila TaxID=1274374 RepID=UPI0005CB493F|nr:ornithine cyclodeaminase family protein [Paenibacillus antibioticophila]